jgi:hypothetical protein
VKRTKPKRKGKVVDITARRREAMDLVQFIDAHGGKLGAFRGYGASQPPSTPPASPVERV